MTMCIGACMACFRRVLDLTSQTLGLKLPEAANGLLCRGWVVIVGIIHVCIYIYYYYYYYYLLLLFIII